jgi:hypothetical protein
MGADGFVASTAIAISDIVDNDADTKEMVVELEPSGKLKIKVRRPQRAAGSAMLVA